MSESFFYDNTIESELAKSGVYASVTKGNSMRPLFKTNRDMIILKTPDGELKKYDVALYRTRSGKYVLHRVVGVRGDIYLVRGDNTFVLERVPKDSVLAVLAEFNRNGKKYTVNSSSYKLYSRVWNFIYPVRYLFHFARSFAYRVYRKLFKKGA
jgi:signal peptidase I